MKLYDYARSSACYRVRIALHLKGVKFERTEIHLVRQGGEHRAAAYLAVNPQGRVPSLELDDGSVLTQSPAILEYLEARFPSPAFLPEGEVARARVRAMADTVFCDIHPLNNLGVLNELRARFGADQAAIQSWYAHWVTEGLTALEQLVAPAPFCAGATPGLADIALVPQLYNARRFEVPLAAFPRLLAIDAACNALEPFTRAHPDAAG